MKKLFAFFVLTFLVCTWSYAQEAPVNRTEEYCEIRTTTKLFRNNLVTYVDYGEGDRVLKDEQGKELGFRSSVGVLNYMNSKGWKVLKIGL